MLYGSNKGGWKIYLEGNLLTRYFSAFIFVLKSLGRRQSSLGGRRHHKSYPKQSNMTSGGAVCSTSQCRSIEWGLQWGYSCERLCDPDRGRSAKITGKYISFRSAPCCLRLLLWVQVFVSLLSPFITAAASPASCGRTHLRGILGLTDVKKAAADAAKNPSKVEMCFLRPLYSLMCCGGVLVWLIMSCWDLER